MVNNMISLKLQKIHLVSNEFVSLKLYHFTPEVFNAMVVRNGIIVRVTPQLVF